MRPELLHGRVDPAGDVVLLSDIAMERQYGRPGLGGGVSLGTADISAHDLRPLRGEQLRARLAHARAGARDEGNLAVK
jgi:hypothetical protein